MAKYAIPYLLKEDDQLCFLHIGKSGGTTLLAILDSMFPDEVICKFRHQPEIRQLSPEQLAQYRLLRGHFQYDIRRFLPKKPVYMTMFRDPVDRARSVYQHILNNPHNKHDIVKSMSLEQFVRADVDTALDIHNWQTRIITSTMNPDKTPDIGVAKKRLERDFAFVGFTERYNESMALLSYTFGWPQINEYETLNITPNRMSREDIPPDVVEHLLEINQIDLELYAFAEQLFEDRMAQLTKHQTQQEKMRDQTLVVTSEQQHPALSALPKPSISYFICSNYRSGSTLMAKALTRTNIAGRPGEYIAPAIMQNKIAEWELPPDDYPAYLGAALRHGMSQNTVYGIKIMYPDMQFLLDNLREVTGDSTSGELALLQQAFPNPHFFYLYRKDKIRQGISFYKLYLTDNNLPLIFDKEEIDLRIEQSIIHNELRWQNFFERNGIKPITLVYEDFSENYAATIRKMVKSLPIPGLKGKKIKIVDPPMKKLGDDLTEEWVERYIHEGGWLADETLRTQVEHGDYALALAERGMQTRRLLNEARQQQSSVPPSASQNTSVNTNGDPSFVQQVKNTGRMVKRAIQNNILPEQPGTQKRPTPKADLTSLPKPDISCFICANYRSGSTLLSVALQKTRAVGRPGEVYAPSSMKRKFTEWSLPDESYMTYLRAVLEHDTTPNNVYSVKIMYPDMQFLVGNLRDLSGDTASREIDLLTQVFPNPRFMYISRRDKIRQGISFYKLYLKDNNKAFVFDLEEIDRRIEMSIIRNEVEWQLFFERNTIEPFRIIYEDFAADYENTLNKVIDYLGISDGDKITWGDPPMEKLADELTEQWVDRYLNEGGWLADDTVRAFVERGDYAPALAYRLDHARGQQRK